MRNQAIRNRILNTDTYGFITFQPATISGLSGSAAAGDTVTFQITGELTIRNETQPVTLNVTVTVEAADRLSGTATTVIQRAAFALTIPSVPQVANVSEAVTLQIDFVAVSAS